MRARYIVVRDRDGVDRLIPNEHLITNEVINWSYADRNVRLKVPVSISYDDDPEQAMALLEEAGGKPPAFCRTRRQPPDCWPSVIMVSNWSCASGSMIRSRDWRVCAPR